MLAKGTVQVLLYLYISAIFGVDVGFCAELAARTRKASMHQRAHGALLPIADHGGMATLDAVTFSSDLRLNVSGQPTRQYALTRPSETGKAVVPLLIYLHAQGDAWPGNEYMKFDELAAKLGIAVIYPKGLGDYDGRNHDSMIAWNVGLYDHGRAAADRSCLNDTVGTTFDSCAAAGNVSRCGWSTCYDDAAFLSLLIRTSAKLHATDPNRVYLTGSSNGGMLTHYLAARLADQLAAVVPIYVRAPACPTYWYPWSSMDTSTYPAPPKHALDPPRNVSRLRSSRATGSAARRVCCMALYPVANYANSRKVRWHDPLAGRGRLVRRLGRLSQRNDRRRVAVRASRDARQRLGAAARLPIQLFVAAHGANTLAL